jgi:hypothetical protein
MRSKFKWIYTFNSVIDSVSICPEKTVTGVVSDDSGTLPGVNVVVRGTKAVLKQMENTLLKQNRRCSSILFCWYG